MSMLVDLMTNAIDQGYLDAAKRRDEGGATQPPHDAGSARANASMVAIVLALAGVLFATAAVATHRGAAAADRGRDQLIREIDEQTTSADQLQRQLSDLQLKVKNARDGAFSASGRGAALGAELSRLEAATGTEAVDGPGAVVTLNDAKNAAGDHSSLGTIFDRDIQAVVDALFANGAEAIAVNGERLTTRTAIREAGDAILVDYRPVAPPYVIDAIGPPDLAQKFLASQTGTLYQNWRQVYGLGFTVAANGRLTLPSAADQVVNYAKPLESP